MPKDKKKRAPVERALRVLLVEDEDSFVEALQVGLAREGFEVTVAQDGIEALEQLSLIHI